MVRRQRPAVRAIVLFFGASLVASASFAADATELFRSSKCNQCHSVEAREINRETEDKKEEGPDLARTTRSADWIVDYVLHRTDNLGKKHMGSFNGKASDLRTIAEWLRTL